MITDVIVLYVMRARHFYREKKYEHAVDPEKAFEFHMQSSPENSEDDDPIAL